MKRTNHLILSVLFSLSTVFLCDISSAEASCRRDIRSRRRRPASASRALRDRRRGSQRGARGGGRHGAAAAAVVASPPPSTSDSMRMNTSASSRHERWSNLLDPLSRTCQEPTALRPDGDYAERDRYYISAEVLTDKLLGYEDAFGDNENGFLSLDAEHVTPTRPIWKVVAGASTGLLAAFPLVLIASVLASSPDASRFFLTILGAPFSGTFRVWVTEASVSMRSSLLQSRSLFHDLKKVQLLPLATKILRKCIIIEVWRLVWFRFYRLTRFLYRGTLATIQKAYVKFCPSWIRRGIRAFVQSAVQSQVQGVMGTALGGITFEGLVWTTPGVDGMGDALSESASESVVQNVLDTAAEESAFGAAEAMSEAVAESAVESALVESLENFAAESVAESEIMNVLIEDAVAASVAESVESFVDGAVDALPDVADSVIESALEDVVGGLD